MPETLDAPPYSPVQVHGLGRRSYEETWALQKRLVEAIGRDDAPETLLLVEHDPVITLGRKAGAAANILDAGDTPVVAIERGGDATWHGPGQLVGYPLLRLAEGERDLHRYLRNLEELLIRALADFGLVGTRQAGLTGVWVGGCKVASLGVAVRRWVTYHGFALNVDADMRDFHRLNPCGLAPGVMASVSPMASTPIPMAAMIDRIVAHVPAVLARKPQSQEEPWPTILRP